MLAEKAALLGQDVETDRELNETPRLTSDEPPSPSDELRSPPPPIVSPGQNHTADPLARNATPQRTGGMSEKARGKMRAVDPNSTSTGADAGETVEVPDEELMKVAEAGVGPNSYIPTQEWVSSWQKGYVIHFLPLSSTPVCEGVWRDTTIDG